MKALIQKTANGFLLSPPFDDAGGVKLDQITVIEGHNYDRLFAMIYQKFEPEKAEELRKIDADLMRNKEKIAATENKIAEIEGRIAAEDNLKLAHPARPLGFKRGKKNVP